MLDGNKKCPSCSVKMECVATNQIYGQRLEIDQCARCGGIWFDDMEIYTVAPDSLEEVKAVSGDLFSSLHSTQSQNDISLTCPNNHGSLQEFDHDKFSEHIKMYNCIMCNGTWAHHTHIKAFVKQRDTLRTEVYDADKSDGQKVLNQYFQKLAKEDRLDEVLELTDMYHGNTVRLPDREKAWSEMSIDEKKIELQRVAVRFSRTNPWLSVIAFIAIEAAIYAYKLEQGRKNAVTKKR